MLVLYVTCLLFPRPTEANGKQTGLKLIANDSTGEVEVSGLSREVRRGGGGGGLKGMRVALKI